MKGPSEHTYPSKRTEKPGGDFTIRHFILPIRIRGTPVWAWLDTGANISILPKEIATQELGLRLGKVEGEYSLAGLVEVPYHTPNLSFDILEYIDGTIPELDIESYRSDGEVAVSMNQVEFQVPTLTWKEMAGNLSAEHPVSIKESRMPFVILGLYGVLDQLNLSFVGNSAVTISNHSTH